MQGCISFAKFGEWLHKRPKGSGRIPRLSGTIALQSLFGEEALGGAQLYPFNSNKREKCRYQFHKRGRSQLTS